MENSDQPEKIKVLYLDDEIINLHSFKAVLRMKFNVFITTDPIEALNLIEQNNIPIIFSDQRMPEMMGTEFLTKVYQKFPDTKRILLTGYTDMTDLIIAINDARIVKYLTKPWDAEVIEKTINELNEEYIYLKNLKDKA